MGKTELLDRAEVAPEAEPAALPMKADTVAMFERLATDPNVDVTKLEKLIEMQERILRHQAKAAFDTAFSKMQGEIPVITERGEIEVEGKVRSRYATNEDIQETVKPILQRYGFSLRFRHEYDGPKMKIIGILSHDSGHSEQDEFLTAPDSGGKMNDIQRIGSARSYGQRYTTLALLNIATRGADDDGHKAGRQEPSKAPDGFEAWWATLPGVTSEGIVAFTKAWNASPVQFRNYVMGNAAHKDEYTRLKLTARGVRTT